MYYNKPNIMNLFAKIFNGTALIWFNWFRTNSLYQIVCMTIIIVHLFQL